MTTKENLKTLIDGLPEAMAIEVLDFAEFVSRKASARAAEAEPMVVDPYALDDEPAVEDEQSAMRIAWAAYQTDCRTCLEDLRVALEV